MKQVSVHPSLGALAALVGWGAVGTLAATRAFRWEA